MTAGMLAGCAILIILGLAFLGVYQGLQERTRLNQAASEDHYQRGLEQLAAENYELARAEFELSVQLNSKNRQAVTKLSEVEALLGSRVTPTSETRHQTAVLLYNEARDLYNKSDWEGVIAKLEQVLALEPEYEQEQVVLLLVEAHGKMGLKLVAEDRMEEAIRHFDRALELRPAAQDIREQQRLATLYVTGQGYWGADWQKAIDNFATLYQAQPGYKDTAQRLHDAHVAFGDDLAAKNDWCATRDQYDSALALILDEALKAKREDAAQKCAASPAPTGTPAAGAFVGRLLRVESVSSKEAMMIRGYVLDAQGGPLSGVQVGLSAFDWSAPPATTDGSGVFAFDGLGNPVTYTVTLVGKPSLPLQVKADWGTLAWVEFRAQP